MSINDDIYKHSMYNKKYLKIFVYASQKIKLLLKNFKMSKRYDSTEVVVYYSGMRIINHSGQGSFNSEKIDEPNVLSVTDKEEKRILHMFTTPIYL